MQLTLELRSTRPKPKRAPGGDSLDRPVRQFYRLRCQPTRIWIGEWAAQDSFYDGLIVRPVERDTMPLHGRHKVEAWRKDDSGRWDKFLTNPPRPQDGVQWISLVGNSRE
jgi:hypothetical protein